MRSAMLHRPACPAAQVNWLPWGEEAIQQAKREDKPIFLSVGYATCHW